MNIGLRQGELFGLLLLSCVFRFGNGQAFLTRFCNSFLRCYNTSVICPILYAYYCRPLCGDLSCGRSDVTGNASKYAMPRIVGGINAEVGEFPWTVYINGNCGGVVIDKYSILTAAHCVVSEVNTPTRIQVGYGSIKKSQLKYIRAKKVVVHPKHDSSNNDNDIAIISLEEPLPLSAKNNFRSVCLPRRSNIRPSGKRCIVTGWGLLSDRITLPDVLQKASLPVTNQQTCVNVYAKFPTILVSNRQMCAGYFGVDACQGDSGGPLFCPEGDRWVVYGIVSAGYGCGFDGYPGVYAYVPYHIDWIRQNMICLHS